LNTKENIVRPWEVEKTVYLWHPPKTGGTSIWYNLLSVSKANGHNYWYRVADPRVVIKENKPFYDLIQDEFTWGKHLPVLKTTIPPDVPSILPVRDPYPRCLSMYAYHVKHSKKNNKPYPYSFAEWFKKYTPMHGMWLPWRPCSYWRHHLTGPVAIIRYEHLYEDFREVTGYKWMDVSYNQTSRWTRDSALLVLSPDDIDLINDSFSEDFEMFGYEKV
jgi:hypothetical protein